MAPHKREVQRHALYRARLCPTTRYSGPGLAALAPAAERGVGLTDMSDQMSGDFTRLLETLEPKFRTLMAMQPVSYSNLPRDIPERGIYLFSEGDRHLYVGRTNRLRRRLAGHCRPSSSHFSATFALRVAREETGHLKASYSQAGSRPALLKDSVFGPAFMRGKARLSRMDLRFVEETDPIR